MNNEGTQGKRCDYLFFAKELLTQKTMVFKNRFGALKKENEKELKKRRDK